MRWKLTLGWAAATATLVIGGCTASLHFVLSRFDANLCATEVFTQVASPSGMRQAVVYETDCGATSGFSRLVGIMPATGGAIDKESLRSFFAISLGSQVDPALSMKEGLVTVQWRSDKSLDIAFPAGARVIRSADRSDGIAVTYRTYLREAGSTAP